MNDSTAAEDQALRESFSPTIHFFWAGSGHHAQPLHPAAFGGGKRGAGERSRSHEVHHVRGLINAALSEAFTMVNQMGAAPGAKWGDLVTGIYTAQGDLAMIAPTASLRSRPAASTDSIHHQELDQ